MVRTLCSLSSLFKSTIEDKYTEKLCKGGATFLTPTYSLQTPKMIAFLAALIWFRLRSRGVCEIF